MQFERSASFETPPPSDHDDNHNNNDDDDSMEIPSPPRSARKQMPVQQLFPTATTRSPSRRPPRIIRTPRVVLTTATNQGGVSTPTKTANLFFMTEDPTNDSTTTTNSTTTNSRKRSPQDDLFVSSSKSTTTSTCSPSIMSMDGRILHSQNPFSSPVVVQVDQTTFVPSDDILQAPSLPTMNNNKYRRTDAVVVPPKKMMMMMRRSTVVPPPTPTKSRNCAVVRTSTTNSSRFANDFDIIDCLGHGNFGRVYKVMSRLDGCLYAVKQITTSSSHHHHDNNNLNEIYALSAISETTTEVANIHIVRYHQSWMEDSTLYIQIELCSGTLQSELLVSAFRPYKVLREMLLALEFIHRHGMCHLDIKPENIFIKNDQYKLGDFGLVVSRSAPKNAVEEGDARYMSLELLSGDMTDLTKSDIFSLGSTVYEALNQIVLPSHGEEWQCLRRGELKFTNATTTDLVHMITAMMQPTPAKRPSAEALLKTGCGTMPPRQALTRANTWSGASLVRNSGWERL